MENALKQLSDDNSLASCIAVGREPPMLGRTSLTYSSVYCCSDCGSVSVISRIFKEAADGFLWLISEQLLSFRNGLTVRGF